MGWLLPPNPHPPTLAVVPAFPHGSAPVLREAQRSRATPGRPRKPARPLPQSPFLLLGLQGARV